MVYKFKEGSRLNADPNKIGRELLSINNNVPEKTVALAQDADTELHKCFTWDDTKAAHAHRLQEARQIISIIVEDVPKTEDHEAFEIRSFTNVHVENVGNVYMPIAEVMANPDYKKEALSDISHAIKSLKSKAYSYRHYDAQKMDTVLIGLQVADSAFDLAEQPAQPAAQPTA